MLMFVSAVLEVFGDQHLDGDLEGLADVLCARGLAVVTASETDLRLGRAGVEPDRRTLLVAGVPTSRRWLRRLGVELPGADYYPTALQGHLHRRVWRSTLGSTIDAVQSGASGPTFVKSVEWKGRLHDSANAPAAYAIDVGVLADGTTALVELNDGFAIAAYGLDPKHYADVLMTRWREIVRSE